MPVVLVNFPTGSIHLAGLIVQGVGRHLWIDGDCLNGRAYAANRLRLVYPKLAFKVLS